MKPAPLKKPEGMSNEEWESGRKRLHRYWSSIGDFTPTHKGSHYLFGCRFNKTTSPQEMLDRILASAS
jgi:hypothetical protein